MIMFIIYFLSEEKCTKNKIIARYILYEAFKVMYLYSKTYVKQPLKNRQNKDPNDN